MEELKKVSFKSRNSIQNLYNKLDIGGKKQIRESKVKQLCEKAEEYATKEEKLRLNDLKKFVFKTQETLDSSLLKTSFLAINCLPKGEHTICVCKMKDQFEIYDNTFYLKKSSGKWLMDAPPDEAQIYQDEELQKIIDSI